MLFTLILIMRPFNRGALGNGCEKSLVSFDKTGLAGGDPQIVDTALQRGTCTLSSAVSHTETVPLRTVSDSEESPRCGRGLRTREQLEEKGGEGASSGQKPCKNSPNAGIFVRLR